MKLLGRGDGPGMQEVAREQMSRSWSGRSGRRRRTRAIRGGEEVSDTSGAWASGSGGSGGALGGGLCVSKLTDQHCPSYSSLH